VNGYLFGFTSGIAATIVAFVLGRVWGAEMARRKANARRKLGTR
jgi:hypothetical protein